MEISNCEISWEQGKDDDVVIVKIEKIGEWLQDFLMISDAHFDSPYCDRVLLKALLDDAVRRNAGIFIWGDWYDAMQSKEDRRRDKDELEEDYKVSFYVDRLVERSAEFLYPYREHIILVAEGNHDTAIKKHLESDIVARLCRELGAMHMGYSCYVSFMFRDRVTGAHRYSKDMYYHHGAGGGAMVTKGTMRAQRERSDFVADIYVGGHIHEDWRLFGTRTQLTGSKKIVTYDTLHCCMPTLKNEWKPRGGFHVEKGRSPRPIGAMTLRFFHNSRKYDNIAFDAMRAD